VIVTKRLSELLAGVSVLEHRGPEDAPVQGLAYDSRAVQAGDLFACLPGARRDGHEFAGEAISRGAAAILAEARGLKAARPDSALLLPSPAVPVVVVEQSRPALARMASNFFDRPSRSLWLAGVTGTNGKTTTGQLLDRILRSTGRRTGIIGTIAHRLGDQVIPAAHTTPEAPDLQALLYDMREHQIAHVSMEVSSHALAQHRADDCEFSVAIFTNLTRDHLDYHASLEDYFAAKARLFEDAAFMPADRPRTNVVNTDEESGRRLAERAKGRVITYGLHGRPDLRGQDLRLTARGSHFVVDTAEGRQAVEFGLIGQFNVYNALAAVGAARAGGISLEEAAQALEGAEPITGRFQRVGGPGVAVVVDYAHTPDGLEKALQTAREVTSGQVYVVFGCGGDRDRGKRPQMGDIATRLADRCYVTSDNPRSENPDAIIGEILAGVPPERRERCVVEPDRASAIHRAIAEAAEGDVVLIAGKGHETYQIFADRTIHFSDQEVAEKSLAGRSGPSN